MYGGDCIERITSGYDRVPMPLHQIGLTAMGLALLDNPDMERLRRACDAHRRRQFLVIVAPLRIPRHRLGGQSLGGLLMPGRSIELGGWSMIGDPIVLEVLARSGVAFVGLDLQHGRFDVADACRGIQLLDALGVPSFVRLAVDQLHDVSRVLDAGARGIIVAMVAAEEARRAVSSRPLSTRRLAQLRRAAVWTGLGTTGCHPGSTRGAHHGGATISFANSPRSPILTA